MAFFTLVLGVGLSIGFLAGDKVPPGTNGGARGWHAFGLMLVTLAVVLGAARNLAHVGFAEAVLRKLPGSLDRKMEFIHSQASVLIPFGIFLAGVTCCVVGRRAMGWSHVVRGIAGWGAFLAFPVLLMEVIWRASSYGTHPVDELPPGRLVALVLTGCVGAALLAWRSRAARLPIAAPLAAGQEMAA